MRESDFTDDDPNEQYYGEGDAGRGAIQTTGEQPAYLALRVSSDPAKLARQLEHAIVMERRAHSRVKRAATLLRKWANTRKRVEKRIGQAEVQRIVTRLSLGVAVNSDSEDTK